MIKYLIMLTVSITCILVTPPSAQADDWSPVLTLENGDQILWKLHQVEKFKDRFLVAELRELSQVYEGVKSLVTHFEIDCRGERIRELSYDYYKKSGAVDLIKTEEIKTNRQRWAYSQWNEYVKFMTGYFCH
ncbi:MAG: hypothetical protein O3A65_04845 [Proteobacteria bacterium]|nr:hypothetical protein [Pseudomonadota bacterium]